MRTVRHAFEGYALACRPRRRREADPYAHHARALLALGREVDALDALAPVIARNPVWLYARLAGDKALARLLDTPPIRAIVAPTPGTLVAPHDGFAVETEPTGRFLAIDAAALPLPRRAQLSEGLLVGDILVVHWRYDSGPGDLPIKTIWTRLPASAPPGPAPATAPPPAHAPPAVAAAPVDHRPGPAWPLALLGLVVLLGRWLAAAQRDRTSSR